jgi:hypothetical protein
MEIKYYNLERIATSYRVVKGNSCIVHVAVSLFFNPKILSLNFEEFESQLKILTDITESNEETFKNRVNEVARLTINYLK